MPNSMLSAIRRLFVAEKATPTAPLPQAMTLEQRKAFRLDAAYKGTREVMRAKLRGEFKVRAVPVDERNHHFMVMVELGICDPVLLMRVEKQIRSYALKQYGVAIDGVFWRLLANVAIATEAVVPTAAHAPTPPAATPAPAAPAPSAPARPVFASAAPQPTASNQLEASDLDLVLPDHKTHPAWQSKTVTLDVSAMLDNDKRTKRRVIEAVTEDEIADLKRAISAGRNAQAEQPKVRLGGMDYQTEMAGLQAELDSAEEEGEEEDGIRIGGTYFGKLQ